MLLADRVIFKPVFACNGTPKEALPAASSNLYLLKMSLCVGGGFLVPELPDEAARATVPPPIEQLAPFRLGPLIKH